MAAKRKKPAPKKKRPSNLNQAGAVKRPSVAKPGADNTLPYQPGVSPGSVDVAGIVPEGVRIDPDITEGHPGYEESGDSEIHPGR